MAKLGLEEGIYYFKITSLQFLSFHFGSSDRIMFPLIKQHDNCETKIMFHETKGKCNLSNKIQASCQVSEWFCAMTLIMVLSLPPTSFLLISFVFQASFLFLYIFHNVLSAANSFFP